MDTTWVVTGAGIITVAGDTPRALHEALVRGIPLGSSIPSVSSGLPAAPIHDFDPKTYLKRKGLKDLSRTSQLACAAASRLLDRVDGVAGPGVGVVFGSAWGSLETVIRFERAAHVDGPRFVDPLLFTETVANVPPTNARSSQSFSMARNTMLPRRRSPACLGHDSILPVLSGRICWCYIVNPTSGRTESPRSPPSSSERPPTKALQQTAILIMTALIIVAVYMLQKRWAEHE